MKSKKKLLVCFLAIGTLFSIITANNIRADIDEEIVEEVEISNDTTEIVDVEIETTNENMLKEDTNISDIPMETQAEKTIRLDTSLAPADWAFTENSIPLHDVIITTYPYIDTNTDGFISITEAQNWSGWNIQFDGIGLTGTLDGLEHFSGLRLVNLNNNSLTGSIPSNIGQITGLEEFYVGSNQLTGLIPDSIYSINSLKHIQLYNNQLSGEISPLIGNLTNLEQLNIGTNNLTGSIPSEIFSLAELRKLHFSRTQIDFGTDLSIFTSFPSLIELSVPDKEIILSEKTWSDVIIVDSPVKGLSGEKIEPISISDSGIFNSSTGNVEYRNSTPIGSVPLNYVVEKNMSLGSGWLFAYKVTVIVPVNRTFSSDAVAKVEDLFTDENHTNIKDITDQTAINNAQEAVDKLPDGALKDELQKEIDKAQDMLDAKNEVEDLFTDESHTDIKDVTDQKTIDDAQDTVSKLPDGSLKDELQKEVDKA